MADLTGLTVTLTGSAQNLATLLAAVLPAGSPLVRAVGIQAAEANTTTVFVGGSGVTGVTNAVAIIPTGQGITLSGGDTNSIDLSSIYVIGTADHTLHVSLLV